MGSMQLEWLGVSSVLPDGRWRLLFPSLRHFCRSHGRRGTGAQGLERREQIQKPLQRRRTFIQTVPRPCIDRPRVVTGLAQGGDLEGGPGSSVRDGRLQPRQHRLAGFGGGPSCRRGGLRTVAGGRHGTSDVANVQAHRGRRDHDEIADFSEQSVRIDKSRQGVRAHRRLRLSVDHQRWMDVVGPAFDHRAQEAERLRQARRLREREPRAAKADEEWNVARAAQQRLAVTRDDRPVRRACGIDETAVLRSGAGNHARHEQRMRRVVFKALPARMRSVDRPQQGRDIGQVAPFEAVAVVIASSGSKTMPTA